MRSGERMQGDEALSGWRMRVTQLAVGLAGLALLHSAVEVVRLALFKYYSIDEFQYAHASWAIANGQVPYRDFFEHHFPLLYQGLAGLWLFTDDHPGNIRYMRVAMIGIIALAALSVGRLNRTYGWLAGLLGPAFMLAMVPYATKATEIRPDSLGTALFVASLAALACVHAAHLDVATLAIKLDRVGIMTGRGVDWRFPTLAGGVGSLQDARPHRTVGSYWPYVSTLWDYVHRAMPFTAPKSLSDDEVYAIVAYVLYLNDRLVEREQRLDARTLPLVRMPNRTGFDPAVPE